MAGEEFIGYDPARVETLARRTAEACRVEPGADARARQASVGRGARRTVVAGGAFVGRRRLAVAGDRVAYADGALAAEGAAVARRAEACARLAGGAHGARIGVVADSGDPGTGGLRLGDRGHRQGEEESSQRNQTKT